MTEQDTQKRGRGRPRKSESDRAVEKKQDKLVDSVKQCAGKPKGYNINFSALDDQSKELYSNIFQEYDANTIYDLREIAKRMGVKSATTLKKEPLVTAMSARRMANTVYCPPKNSVVAPVTYDEVEMITDDYLMKTLVVDFEIKGGILDIAEDGAWLRVEGFAPSDADIFIPMLLVNDLMLLPGDEISGCVRFMQKSGRLGLFKAEKINGQNAQTFVRRDLAAPVMPREIVRLKGGSKAFSVLNAVCPVSKGQRKLIIGLGALKLDFLARELSRALYSEGLLTINLFLDESPETMAESAALPGENLVFGCESFGEYDRAVNLAVDRAKRIAPYGKDIVIILNNADVLSEETLRAVYGAGRFTEGGSITTIIISSALELTPVINRLSRTANSITVFKNNIGAEPVIDLKRSFSENEPLLSKVERQTLSDLRKQMADAVVSVRDCAAAYEIILAANKKEE